MSQAELRRIIRNPRSTSQQLGDAVRMYLAARRMPHKPIEVYTREEHQALCDRRRKRKPKRKREYDSIESGRLAITEHAPELDDQHSADVAWIGEFAKRHWQEMVANAYHGEW